MIFPRFIRRALLLVRLVCFILPLFVTALVAPAAERKPLVVATNTILDDFVRTLGGDGIETRCLLTPGRDPHTYDPTPADVRLLARADAIVVNGLGFENGLEKLIRNSGFRGALITASEGVAPLRATAEHDHAHHDGHPAHAHDHDHGTFDPHAWHDLRRAARYIETLRDALARLVPSHADVIRARALDYLGQLETLNTQFRERLTALPANRRKLVTSHDSLRYLGEAYGLTIIPIAGLRSGREPSAKKLAALVKRIRREAVPAIFVESTTNPKIPTLIAREAGVVVIDSLYTDSLGDHNTPGSTFLGAMRANLETLLRALR
jgi:zinc/manganese transport system substrate-binding protein